LARDGSIAHRLARRAYALVLLDDGMSCAAVAKVLFLDNDTIRTWYQAGAVVIGPARLGDDADVLGLNAQGDNLALKLAAYLL
jgi:hypothetical protein